MRDDHVTRNDDTFERLATVVRRTFRLRDSAAVEPHTESSHIEGWDSLSHSMLIMNVEDEFHILLDSQHVYAVNNVGELAQLIRQTVTGKTAT